MTLTTAYFPPVEYFAKLAGYSSVYIEACENYQKQSYRNRCLIYASDGVQMLNFPVRHVNGSFELPIREIEVDYSTPWTVRTERCIDTAYRSAPFFDFYRDSLFSILDSHPRTLWELNTALTEYFIGKLGLRTELVPTRVYGGDAVELHPKRPSDYAAKPYWQVFSGKRGFVPNLSVMDLLFNEGPEAICYL